MEHYRQNNTYLTYQERRELWYKKRYEAEHAFFSHKWDSQWQRLHRIPEEHTSPLLKCAWCTCQAVYFQMIPAHALFCALCAKELRKMRRSQYLKNKRYREKEIMLQLAERWANEKRDELEKPH